MQYNWCVEALRAARLEAEKRKERRQRKMLIAASVAVGIIFLLAAGPFYGVLR